MTLLTEPMDLIDCMHSFLCSQDIKKPRLTFAFFIIAFTTTLSHQNVYLSAQAFQRITNIALCDEAGSSVRSNTETASASDLDPTSTNLKGRGVG